MARGTKRFVTCQPRMYAPREKSHLTCSKRPLVIIVRVERSPPALNRSDLRDSPYYKPRMKRAAPDSLLCSGPDKYMYKAITASCHEIPFATPTSEWNPHFPAQNTGACTTPLGCIQPFLLQHQPSGPFIVSVLCTTKSGTPYLLVIDVIYSCVIN